MAIHTSVSDDPCDTSINKFDGRRETGNVLTEQQTPICDFNLTKMVLLTRLVLLIYQ